MTKRQNRETLEIKGPKNEYLFLYWDEYQDLKKYGMKMNGRELVADSEREDSLIAMEGDRFYKGKPKKKERPSRVKDLFAKFEKLSRIEKENFINLIRNYIKYG